MIKLSTPVFFANDNARLGTLTALGLAEPIIYRAKRTYAKHDAGGRLIGRSVIRTSTQSLADAETRAYIAAKTLVEGIISGTHDGKVDRYAYEVGKVTEPLYEEVCDTSLDRPQTLVGRVTVNSYGVLVINCDRVMFVDVDTATEKEKGSQPLISETRALELLDTFIANNPDYGFRVYKTFAGLRYLCTSHLVVPESDLAKSIMTELNADRSYRALCRVQKCFRARLTPKPWRMVNAMTGIRPQVRTRITSLSHYLTQAQANATCRFVKAVGVDNHLPYIERIRSHHDYNTQATSNKPLA